MDELLDTCDSPKKVAETMTRKLKFDRSYLLTGFLFNFSNTL